ncbi:uncharacterized protein LOC130642386 [Hydractinia symbiolongicarpus]|uniref:uncharacterized protein LOC130642386 n=1 Tax=Hydractinia symbiolongicarpus TaxID=13093 RepID=UPI00254E0353|nr:uncharacterized protein LOC130642386 [Hydractinia symbiolongicarpus]
MVDLFHLFFCCFVFFCNLNTNTSAEELRTKSFEVSSSKENPKDLVVVNTVEDVTEIQCLHRCNLHADCDSVGFELYDQERIGECLLLSKQGQEKLGPNFIFSEHEVNDLKLIHQTNYKNYNSCKAAYINGERKSRVYYLKDLGWHFCNMDDLKKCGSGGWTLALNADGQKATFEYYSDYWTNSKTYNVNEAINDPLRKEAKYKAFLNLPFTYICLGMRIGSNTKYIKLEKPYSSLFQLFANIGKDEKRTNIEEKYWRELVPDGSLQSKCFEQGFNIEATAVSLRLGAIAGKDDGDCANDGWTDSWVGIGGEAGWCTDLSAFSAGSGCCMETLCKTGPNAHIAGIASLYIQ